MIARLAIARRDHLLVRQRETSGLRPEDLLGHLRQPADDPALAVEVVHREHAAGLEPRLDVAERLLGEQEALQPEARIARVQHQRIDQGVDDQVVLAVGLADEAAAVVEVDRDPRVVVRAVRDGRSRPSSLMTGSISTASTCLAPVPERGGDVVARAGADDQHVVERRAAGVAVQQVRQHVGRPGSLDLDASPGGRCCWSSIGRSPGRTSTL